MLNQNEKINKQVKEKEHPSIGDKPGEDLKVGNDHHNIAGRPRKVKLISNN